MGVYWLVILGVFRVGCVLDGYSGKKIGGLNFGVIFERVLREKGSD